ncbi:hypothetical protein BGX24_005874 [Mortierella sp. AD032]|nr:hypothetical protein BGX24_005874 [Mortierella sp. AD032]
MAGITMTSCTALTSSRNSPMDEDDIDMTTGQGQISAAAGAVEVDDEILGQEPTSLVCMNMTRFLRDPVEQSRVLRMELQALKEDLESLHNMML